MTNSGLAPDAEATAPTSRMSVPVEAIPAAKSAPRSMIVDVVKGMAISLVVLGHTNQGIMHRGWWGSWNLGLKIEYTIYSFHMPAFFFVAGIFLLAGVRKRGPALYTIEKLRSLIYPYLLWAVIFYIGGLAFSRFMMGEMPGWRQYLLNVATGTAWFLPTIFIVLMLGMLLRKVPLPLLFALSSLSGVVTTGLGENVLVKSVHELPFLAAGMWVGFAYQKIEQTPKLVSVLVAAAMGSAILTAVAYHVTNSRYAYIPLGLAGTLMLALVAQLLGRNAIARMFSWIGEGSFGLFLLSAYPQGAGREILLRVFHTTNPIVQLIFPTLLAIFVPCWLYSQRARLHIGWLFIYPSAPPRHAPRLETRS